jgi:hypothetical protein
VTFRHKIKSLADKQGFEHSKVRLVVHDLRVNVYSQPKVYHLSATYRWITGVKVPDTKKIIGPGVTRKYTNFRNTCSLDPIIIVGTRMLALLILLSLC